MSHIQNWKITSKFRWAAFLTVLVIVSLSGTLLFADLLWRLPYNNGKWLLLVIFSLLFVHLSFGFVQACFGMLALLKKDDSLLITELDEVFADRQLSGRTALLFPIYNEDPAEVTANIAITYKALQRKGILDHYDFFLLSDSNQVNNWIEEETAWLKIVRDLDARGKIFYRKRRANLNQKSGNIADFLRRWGKLYDFFVCYDADSLMTADTLFRITRIMENTPELGILQTMPRLYNGKTLFARIQQFGNRIHGLIGGAGLNYWQQGEGNYWGHNAIIRTQDFIDNCSLPELPGKRPLGGRVMSHDFVEAALMRKAGLQVWLAYDLEGSYEEMPPSIPDFAIRDQRWCQGNLQHLWLVLFGRIALTNRLHMLNGVMAYLSGPLWLLFLVLATLIFYSWENSGLTMFPLPPLMPFAFESTAQQGLAVFLLTFTLILIPKLFPLMWLARNPKQLSAFGGYGKVVASLVIELVMFTLIAPSIMLFHCSFVVSILLGRRVAWNKQRRSSGGIGWKEAFSAQGGHLLIGILWGILAWYMAPPIFWWMTPVLLGWVLATPLTVLTSKASLGRWFAQHGLLTTPEENCPVEEIAELRAYLDEQRHKLYPIPELEADYGLIHVAIDPFVNSLHQLFLRERGKQAAERDEDLTEIRERLLVEGAEAVSDEEKFRLLYDISSVDTLHEELWARPLNSLAPWWQLAMKRYNHESIFRIVNVHQDSRERQAYKKH